MLFWSRPVAEVINISQVQGTQLPQNIVLGNRYQHLNFPLPDSSWTLDNTAATPTMFAEGHRVGRESIDSLRPRFFPRKPIASSSLALDSPIHYM